MTESQKNTIKISINDEFVMFMNAQVDTNEMGSDRSEDWHWVDNRWKMIEHKIIQEKIRQIDGEVVSLNFHPDEKWLNIKVNSINKIKEARKVMRDAFEADPGRGGFKYSYISNIAMLLHDHYGITDYEERNRAAKDILQLVFYNGE